MDGHLGTKFDYFFKHISNRHSFFFGVFFIQVSKNVGVIVQSVIVISARGPHFPKQVRTKSSQAIPLPKRKCNTQCFGFLRQLFSCHFLNPVP